MRKRIFQICLVSVLIIIGPVSAAASTPEDVPIFVLDTNVVYKVEPGQIGMMQSRWIACNEKLVRTYIKAVHFELTLYKNGEKQPYLFILSDQVDNLWDSIEPYGYPADECVVKGTPSISTWKIPLPTLPEGVYKLYFHGWVDHPITDGSDYDGDGEPDVFPPEFIELFTVNTVIVVK